ncbi:MAG: 4Fe-4S binding protein [Synergistaceae bacterium]|jgi:epoxyqueuosine reductase QueG|nr:4Fe-4S binding protein [Synergistaceae bacterium]
MNLGEITDFIGFCIEEGGGNYVARGTAISPELASMKMFGAFLLGVASPDDGLFERFRTPGVVGPEFMLPRGWLLEARSVISVFFHVTPRVERSNAADRAWPSSEWLHARIEGQSFISATMASLKEVLEKKGYPTAIPSNDPRFATGNFTSNWSERHVAYACGLGTFGLSKGLITRLGMAGRLGSVVTALDLPPSRRDYSGVFDWCPMCGACAANCPVGAISLKDGKNHEICSNFLDKTLEKHSPRYGCGKCQVSTPCQNGAPGLGNSAGKLIQRFPRPG